jgi:hypothetical protein
MPYQTDNRWSPGASGAAGLDVVNGTAPAAYAARWIDNGDNALASVLGDRQGFAYNNDLDRQALVGKLVTADEIIRDMGDRPRETPLAIAWDDEWQCHIRRSGGYVYVDAWLAAP